MQMNKNILDIFEKANVLRETAQNATKEQSDAAVVVKENKQLSGYVGVTGIRIKDDGTITKNEYLKTLQIDENAYAGMSFTDEEVAAISYTMKRQSSGINSSIPIRCTGDMCPFKNSCPYFAIGKAPIMKPCQPPGSLVLTANRGYVPIEELIENDDKIVNFGSAPGGGGTRRIKWSGSKFKLGSRHYSGELIKIEAEGKSHECTDNHICLAKFNNNALGKFIVYMMEKNGKFRIGKTLLYRITNRGKVHSGLMARMRSEEADKAWILGYFDTNTEALLAEEYFSCKFGIPKACFVTNSRKQSKYDGLYRWVTQDQLDCHFRNLQKPICEYDLILRSIGLRYDLPFIDKTTAIYKRAEFSMTKTFEIYACNLVGEIMDVIVVDNENDKNRHNAPIVYKPIKVSRRQYDGPVYSMAIEKHPTYISDGIITHNCLVEAQLIHHWTEQYMDEFNVDPANITELHMVSELAEFNVYEMRITKYLAENHPTLMQDVVVGIDNTGTVIENQEISKAFDLKDRIKRNRMKVLEALMATRKEKMKIVSEVIGGSTSSQKMAELKSKIMSLSQEVKMMKAEDIEFVEV